MKRACFGVLIACLTILCGCGPFLESADGNLRKSSFSAKYPASHALHERLSREDALVLLRQVFESTGISSWRAIISYPVLWPNTNFKSAPTVSGSGLECIFDVYRNTSGWTDAGVGWYEVTIRPPKRQPDHIDSMEWQTIKYIHVMEEKEHGYAWRRGPGWHFKLGGKWTKGAPFLDGDFLYGDYFEFTVISEKHRDQVMAALFRLCPNIKGKYEGGWLGI